MQSNPGSHNPYQPPVAVHKPIVGVIRSFQVGVREFSTVFVESSLWTGLRTYAVDAAGVTGPVHQGACRFEVGTQERHRVEIEIDGLARVNAYVDGELVEPNLLSGLRVHVFFRVAVVMVLIAMIVGLVLLLFGYYRIDKVIEQWFS